MRKIGAVLLGMWVMVLIAGCNSSDESMRKLVELKTGGKVVTHKVISRWDYYFVCKEGTTIIARVNDSWPTPHITDDVVLDPNDFPCRKKE